MAGRSKDFYDPIELARGTAIEMEHTDDPAVAEQIAMDHLDEDPIYYTKLTKCFKGEHNPDYWTKREERQYKNIKESYLHRGYSDKEASRIAAATVNKARAKR